jgi:translation initiation factor 1
MAGLNQAFDGLDLEPLKEAPAGGPVEKLPVPNQPAQPPQNPLWKMGRVVLRRETAHRGGKVVVVVDDFATHLPLSVIERVAKKLRGACGCGGTVRGRSVELQGDHPAKIRALLEAEGFTVAGVR